MRLLLKASMHPSLLLLLNLIDDLVGIPLSFRHLSNLLFQVRILRLHLVHHIKVALPLLHSTEFPTLILNLLLFH